MKDSARKHNETVYLNCGLEKLEIQVDHVISGNPSEEAREKCLLVVKTTAKYSEVLGLQRVLKVGVELAYTTSVNIETDNGLINGATCILKKIHYFKSNASKCPQKYSAYYNEGIGKTWTPIFGVSRHFAVSNGKVMQTQFPLKPASGTTIHGAQGCTFNKICIDMDLSDSLGLSKNQNLAKSFLQHTHYVAANRVGTLQGLQIISWKLELISVNQDVKEHMDYLKTHRKFNFVTHKFTTWLLV